MVRKVLEGQEQWQGTFLIKYLLLCLNLFEGAQKHVKYYPG